jgi:hypothetical protein
MGGWSEASSPCRPFQPVVYISGIELDAASKRGRNSIFLRKPVNVSDLVATFERLRENQRRS